MSMGTQRWLEQQPQERHLCPGRDTVGFTAASVQSPWASWTAPEEASVDEETPVLAPECCVMLGDSLALSGHFPVYKASWVVISSELSCLS